MSLSGGLWTGNPTRKKSWSNSHFRSDELKSNPLVSRSYFGDLAKQKLYSRTSNQINPVNFRSAHGESSHLRNRLTTDEIEIIRIIFSEMQIEGKCCLWSLVDAIHMSPLIQETSCNEAIIHETYKLKDKHGSGLWVDWEAFRAMLLKTSLVFPGDPTRRREGLGLLTREDLQRRIEAVMDGCSSLIDVVRPALYTTSKTSVMSSATSLRDRLLAETHTLTALRRPSVSSRIEDVMARNIPTTTTTVDMEINNKEDEGFLCVHSTIGRNEDRFEGAADSSSSYADSTDDNDNMDVDGDMDGDTPDTGMVLVSSSSPERRFLAMRQRPLSPQEEGEVRSALSPPHDDQVLVEKFNIPMSRAKLSCLTPGAWLNDEVINFYMQLLKTRDDRLCLYSEKKQLQQLPQGQVRRQSWYFSSFFMDKLLEADKKYNFNNIKRWSKKFDVFAMEKLFFPINLKNTHWTLAVVYVQRKSIRYLDSMAGGGDRHLQALLRYMSDESKAKRGVDIDPEEWELVRCTQTNTPQQQNGVDCGVFATMMADFLSDDIDPLHLTQNDISHFRRKICHSILRGELPYDDNDDE
eukprot:gene13083-27619_t